MPAAPSVVGSLARTVSGQTSNLAGFRDRRVLRCQLNVTAVGADPAQTLDVFLEESVDGGTTWNVLLTFAQATVSPTRQVLDYTAGPFGDELRVRWVIAGTTPSFTFDVRLHAE